MPRILTLNLNYYVDKHGPWEERRALILDTLRRHAPDVLVLQAVKRDPEVAHGADQAQQLATALAYPHVWYEPAATHEDGTAEGSAFVSRVPMYRDDVLELSVGTWDEDVSPRLVLAANFSLPGGDVRIFNSHYSWVYPRTEMNYEEAAPFMDRFGGARIIAGDLNTQPTTQLMSSTLPHSGWRDAWAALRPAEAGATFQSNAPSIRIDYFWASSELHDRLAGIELIRAESADRRVRMSDHLGLLLTLA